MDDKKENSRLNVTLIAIVAVVILSAVFVVYKWSYWRALFEMKDQQQVQTALQSTAQKLNVVGQQVVSVSQTAAVLIVRAMLSRENQKIPQKAS